LEGLSRSRERREDFLIYGVVLIVDEHHLQIGIGVIHEHLLLIGAVPISSFGEWSLLIFCSNERSLRRCEDGGVGLCGGGGVDDVVAGTRCWGGGHPHHIPNSLADTGDKLCGWLHGELDGGFILCGWLQGSWLQCGWLLEVWLLGGWLLGGWLLGSWLFVGWLLGVGFLEGG